MRPKGRPEEAFPHVSRSAVTNADAPWVYQHPSSAIPMALAGSPMVSPEDRTPALRQSIELIELIESCDVRDLERRQMLTDALERLAAELDRRLVPTQSAAVSPDVARVPAANGEDSVPDAGSQDQAIGEPAGAGSDFASIIERKLALLTAVMRLDPPRLEPTLSPEASLGHVYPVARDALRDIGQREGRTHAILEELSDLGLLQRQLINRIHTCPKCERCQINFREQCPRCRSIDLRIERVLHHFRCGYNGIESEFGNGLDKSCPKCHRPLFQLGQDFDRPHETYACRDCSTLFEDPKLGVQCLGCCHEFDSHEAVSRSVYAYVPTPLALRAVELGRLTGLDVDSILYDADLKIATPDFLEFEIKRELVRLGRHKTAFSTATLSFERAGRWVPIFREWSAGAIRELCVTLSDALRTLDLVTRLNPTCIAVLMPEADASGAEVVHRRLFKLLGEMHFIDAGGNDLVPVWRVATWSASGETIEDVRSFLQADRGETAE